MKITILFMFLLSLPAFASVMGVSTHPLNEEARVLTAEMTGYMSQRHEMGAGLRYTQETGRGNFIDLSASGAQEARGFAMGAGLDMEVLSEDINQPRVSFKSFWQQQKFKDLSTSTIGAAPSVRKGFSMQGYEFFPYLALPNGIKVDNKNDEFVFYSAVSLGASMPFPGAQNDRVLLTVEGNKNLGASSDYLGCLVSWMWN